MATESIVLNSFALCSICIMQACPKPSTKSTMKKIHSCTTDTNTLSHNTECYFKNNTQIDEDRELENVILIPSQYYPYTYHAHFQMSQFQWNEFRYM